MTAPILLALYLSATPNPANPPKDAKDARSELLDAMASELHRNQVELTLKENKPPYFIAYQVKDFDRREVSARYGALFTDAALRDRGIFVDVRVGDYAFDSSISSELDFAYSAKGPSYLAARHAPIDDSPVALKTALWLLTDEKYKAALLNFLKRQGEAITAVDEPKRPASFSREVRAEGLGKPATFGFDRARWVALARELSAQLARESEFFDSQVRITGDKVQRLAVNSEGTRLATEEVLYSVHVEAFTRADDGQLLDNARDWYGPTEAHLPSDAAIRAQVKAMMADLKALRRAPTIDPYAGPAILEPDAAGVLFHEAVGHRLEGERQDNDSEGKTFRGQVGKEVLPPFLSIVDDPTLQARAGVRLNGYYSFDDEAVPAQKVVLVEDGVLRNYLLSRKPVEGFFHSNGHGRAQSIQTPIARMANLIVESKKRVSRAELKAQLISEARRQGKPYGLILRDIASGNTNTTSYGYQAFKGSPRMVFRVDVETGEETLVRGVEIVGTPLSSINRVLATGDTEGVFNGFCGAESGMVPVSTVAPAVLLQEIELQRAVEGKERPPLLKSPASMQDVGRAG